MPDLPAGRGHYRYFLNGEAAPVQESWQVEAIPGGQRLQCRRWAPGLELAVSADMVDGGVVAFEVSHGNGNGDGDAPHRCQVRRNGDWRWHLPGDKAAAVSLDAAVITYPLMRIFTGPVIRAIAAGTGEAQVAVPLLVPAAGQRPLAPDVSARRVCLLGDEPCHLASGEQVAGQRWQFVGGQYDERAAFWLDAGGRLLAYRWQQSPTQCWEVRIDF